MHIFPWNFLIFKIKSLTIVPEKLDGIFLRFFRKIRIFIKENLATPEDSHDVFLYCGREVTIPLQLLLYISSLFWRKSVSQLPRELCSPFNSILSAAHRVTIYRRWDISLTILRSERLLDEKNTMSSECISCSISFPVTEYQPTRNATADYSLIRGNLGKVLGVPWNYWEFSTTDQRGLDIFMIKGIM